MIANVTKLHINICVTRIMVKEINIAVKFNEDFKVLGVVLQQEEFRYEENSRVKILKEMGKTKEVL